MFAHERHQNICAILLKKRSASVAELQSLLGISRVTVRRDLAFLERLGKVSRTHGGVLHPDAVNGEMPFERKAREAVKAKLAIAALAAALAPAHGQAFVDSGTTTLETGRLLLRRGNDLTIVTNSVPLLGERPEGKCRLVAVGGEVRTLSMALVGGGALAWVRNLRLDIAFLGCSGTAPGEGVSTTELSEAEFKSQVVARARRVVLLADFKKWNAPAAIRFANWEQIDDFVTDYRPNRTERAALSRRGVRLHIAQP